VINASVIPSTKYACSGSPEKFFSGSTARELIRGATASKRAASEGGPFFDTEIQAETPASNATTTRAATSTSRRGRPAAGETIA
jgi:hypothetical protein